MKATEQYVNIYVHEGLTLITFFVSVVLDCS